MIQWAISGSSQMNPINIITQSTGKLKETHSVDESNLSNSFDEDLLPLREKRFLSNPEAPSTPYPLIN